MKVYLVYQVDSEPYEDYWSGIHAVFLTREAAEEYLANPLTSDDWFVTSLVEERDVKDHS